jgi:exopolysaccharide biosynthesis polyprenyl glycosylphosphotransferase
MIVGSGCKALNIMDSIRDEKNPGGNLLIGYVRINGEISLLQDDKITDLGEVTYLQEIIKKNKIEEVIIAIEGNGYLKICEIINTLTFSDVRIKTIPSIYDILTGRVNHTTIYATPLLEISNRSLPLWQSFFKIILDYAIAVFSLIVMSPVMLILAILIKFSGKGTVIYSHQRIGKNGKPFTIYKFRSMYINSENGVPLLSGINDSRITPVGQFMRRHRLDELPNLINVIKGEMSIVGPRPERQHFIDQIVKKAPHYRRLHKVKPGLTSWGQVKYGYASNVDMMIERLQYDLLYVKNMSVLIDLKIILYTILIILKGKGI